MHYCQLDSPLGPLLLCSDGRALTGLHPGGSLPEGERLREEDPVFTAAAAWLERYFAADPAPAEDLPIMPEGTAFQREVWALLLQIPWGQTRTYGQIARQLALRSGRARVSARAVGQAVGRNPIGILIPCHRCIGAGGRLTGYAWGLEKKKWLLRHEGMEGELR